MKVGVWADAKKILGEENVVDPQKVDKYLNIVFPVKIFEQLSETLASNLNILKGLNGSHSLFLGLPWDPKGNELKLLKMGELYKTANIPWHHSNYFDGTDETSNRICNFGLYLVPHQIPEDTFCKTFDEAVQLIKSPVECPSAIEVLCFDLQPRMINKKPLLADKAVLCKDEPGKDLKVVVEFKALSIDVQLVHKGIAGSEVGILPMRKLSID